MANYIVHHTKKRQILARKEQALHRALAGGEAGRIHRAAREVRDARVRALKARLAAIPPDGSVSTEGLEQLIADAEASTVDEIIAEFHEGRSRADGS